MVKIRLQRAGAKKRPFYRVVVMDQRRARDGRALEFLGTYDPRPDPQHIDLRLDRVDAWIANGAQLSDTLRSLVKRAREQPVASATPAAEGGGS